MYPKTENVELSNNSKYGYIYNPADSIAIVETIDTFAKHDPCLVYPVSSVKRHVLNIFLLMFVF